jgi:stress response protein SCP2
MAISLKKGQGISLSKSEFDLAKVTIGLGWDVADSGGFLKNIFGGKQEEYDLDAIAFLCHADGKVHRFGDKLVGGDVVFFNSQRHPSGKIWLTGDNRTGAGDGDDEQIVVLLDSMPADIAKIVFLACIYQGQQKQQHFGKVENAFIRAVDARGREMVRTDLSASPETQNMCSIVFAELNRTASGWEFKSLLRPERTDSFATILRDYYIPAKG